MDGDLRVSPFSRSEEASTIDRRYFLTGASALAVLSRFPKAWAASSRSLIFLGTRTNAPGKGIYSFFFDAETGTCTPAILAAEIASPTAFALSPNKRILYSVSELGNDGKSDGAISALTIDSRTGRLTLLNKVPSGGGGPTYLSVDPTGKLALVSCFGSGRTNVFRLLPDGKLAEQTTSITDTGSGPTPRQASPHVHCSVFSPDNRFILSADFGADRVFIFKLDSAPGTLTPNDVPSWTAPAGSGPRQIVFHPNGKFAYLMSELVGQLTVFAWGAKDGTLTEVQTVSCFAADAPSGDRSGAGLVIRHDGRFLYTTTRSDNSIEVFKVDAATGKLVAGQRVVSDGKLPWSCALDPAGDHFITTNLTSNSASMYGVDPATGDIKLVASIPNVPSPVCALFVPV
jgi:6-phosphogluconolactonase